MLPLSTIWKDMHALTDCAIEKRAVFELVSYLESQIVSITKLGEEELRRQNKLRKMQSLPVKKRIGAECIREAIKNISIESDSPKPKKAGGIKEKEVEKNGTQEIEVV